VQVGVGIECRGHVLVLSWWWGFSCGQFAVKGVHFANAEVRQLEDELELVDVADEEVAANQR
jgi:hypothetical protein